MNVLISVAIVILISVVSIGIVFVVGSRSIEQTRSFSQMGDMEQFMNQIDNAVGEVVAEGRGSSRSLTVTIRRDVYVNPMDESVEYKSPASGFFDYMSRRKSGNFLYIYGGDVSCSESDDNGDGASEIVAENSRIKAVFQKINKTSPLANYSTSRNIISMLEKSSMQKVSVSNSSIIIDDNSSTSYGNGYSELLETGSGLPLCKVHFFINSTTLMYDVYYTLYNGADFIIADVRNVIDK